MKFIIFEGDKEFIPILFSGSLRHSEVAGNLKDQIDSDDPKIISAGFVKLKKDGNILCFGESTSLNVKSRGKEDSEIIEEYLRIT